MSNEARTLQERNESMQAVQYHEYGGADVLGVEEVQRPSPNAEEVLVEISAASVNPVDVMFRTGEYGQIPLPSIPGGDGAGVVVAVGDDVDSFEAGDRVFASGMDRADGGTFAEYAAIPATKLAHLPDTVSFKEGAAIANVGATAWTALQKVAGIQQDDIVLIHGGAGGVGHAAVQIADTEGAEVIATAGSEAARNRVREFGATAVLDYDSDTLAEDVLAATDGDGVDVVLDHRLEEYLGLDFEVLTHGGQIVSLMGHIPQTSGAPFYHKEVTLTGLKMDNRPVRAPVLNSLAELLAEGKLSPVVANTYEMDKVAQAHRDVMAGGYVGKLVVTP